MKKQKNSKKKSVKDTKVDIKKQVKEQIKRMSEKKYIDNYTTSEVISGGQFTCINAMQPGAGFWQRIGKKIKMCGIRIKGEIYPNQTNTAAFVNHTEFRIAIVYDKQANAAVPSTYGTVFQDRGTGTTQISVASNVNIENRERFVVIHDERVQLPPIGVTGTISTKGLINTNIKTIIDDYHKINLEVGYNAGTAGTIADINTGSLLLVLIADAGATGAENHAYSFQWNTRLYFRDI